MTPPTTKRPRTDDGRDGTGGPRTARTRAHARRRGRPGPAAPSTQPTTGRPAHGRTRDLRWPVMLVSVAVIAVASRLANLGTPTDGGTPVFDEKHYVPQSWQILRSAANPLVGGIEDNPGYGLVVHPPLAKQLEAVGMALFGYTPWGWRIASAVAAVAVILLIMGIARRISRSDLVGLLAGLIAVCDGILFVTGRSAMLDHIQTVFVTAAVYLLVRDHGQMNARFARVWAEQRMADSPLGPRMGYRWWRFAAGVCLGCALAVKWSGLYYMAFFGLAVVGLDVWRRRRWGVARPWAGALMRDAVPAAASIVLVPVMVYLFSWRAWFASETGVYRHIASSGVEQRVTDWHLGWLPDSVVGFLWYHVSVLDFHASLTNSNGHYHAWESKPWSWLATTRSLLYYSSTTDDGARRTELLVGTPAVWWLTVPVMLWGLWCLVVRRDLRWAVPVVGFAAGFLPWLADIDRQMYLFYAVNLAPFLVIALALALGQLSRWSLRPAGDDAASDGPATATAAGAPASGAEVRPGTGGRLVAWLRMMWLTRTGAVLACVYTAVVVWNFLYFLPLYTALPLTTGEWESRMWLPSWR